MREDFDQFVLCAHFPGTSHERSDRVKSKFHKMNTQITPSSFQLLLKAVALGNLLDMIEVLRRDSRIDLFQCSSNGTRMVVLRYALDMKNEPMLILLLKYLDESGRSPYAISRKLNELFRDEALKEEPYNPRSETQNTCATREIRSILEKYRVSF